MSDPFSVASGVLGVVSLGLNACQGLLQYYSSWKDSQKDVAVMCASLEGLTKTFRLVEGTIEDRKFNQAIVDRVTASIDLCETGVDELNAKLLKVKMAPVKGAKDQTRGQFRRALYPFKQSTLLKLREAISDLRDNLSLAISTLQLDVSATSLQKMNAIDGNLTSLMGRSGVVADGVAKLQLSQAAHDEQLRRERRLTTIRWLSPLHFGDKQKDILGGRQEGTGGWLLRDTRFTDWLEGKTRTLWCPGMPGAGKTVLASIIIDHLQQKIQSSDVAVAYIYCDYKEQGQTVANLVASIVQQLAEQQPVFPNELSALYDNHTKARTTPSLLEYSEMLRLQIPKFSKLLIVIDALDECLDGDRAVFLDEMQNLSPAPYLLVTSRHIPTVERSFRQATTLEIEAKEEDVRAYLETWLDQQVLWVRLVTADQNLREQILSTILANSHGMFLLAVLRTNLLAGEDNKRDLMNALQNLPTELDDTYDRAMRRIEDQSRQQVKRAEQVLSWVTLAERPLTVKEIQCALAVAPGDEFLHEDALPDEDLLVSVCAGLVVIDQQKSIIRLVHYTTQDYLERTLEARYPHAQRNICATCITYLSFEVFKDGPCKEDQFGSNMIDRAEQNMLFDYAANNWGIHARKASDHDTTIDELVHEFLDQSAKFSSSYQTMHRSQRWPFCTPTRQHITGLIIASSFGLKNTVVSLLREGHDVNASDSQGCSSLHIAASMGHANVVQLLLEAGANLEAKCRKGETALHWAAYAGREQSVRVLLEWGSDPTYDGFGTESMISEAAYRGYVKVVQTLLLHINDLKNRNDCAFAALAKAASNGQEAVAKTILEGYANPEEKCRYAAAILHNAARGKQTSMLKLLLEYTHASISVDEDIQKALWSAAKFGSEASLRVLLDAGADPNKRPDYSQTPDEYFPGIIMHYPIPVGHLEVVKMLVNAGGDIELSTKGWTPLLLAAREGRTEILRYLLEMGANTAVEEQETGRRALQWAAIAGDLEAVHLLLQREGESSKDNGKWTTLAQLFKTAREYNGAGLSQTLGKLKLLDPKDSEVLELWFLVAENGQESTLEALLSMGIDIEAKDHHGTTALILTAINGQEGIVRLLLCKGADANVENDQQMRGGTPLSYAAEGGHAGVVRLLLDAGAKVETEHQRKTGSTPLNMAAWRFKEGKVEQKYETTIQLLIEHGANTEIAGAYCLMEGDTLLIMVASPAYRPKSLSTLRLLLERGANVEAKDSKGETALSHAIRKGSIAAARLLLERGADLSSVDLATISPWYYVSQDESDECVHLIQQAQREKTMNTASNTASEVEEQVAEGATEDTDVVGEPNTPILA